jgi:hypothetical protein
MDPASYFQKLNATILVQTVVPRLLALLVQKKAEQLVRQAAGEGANIILLQVWTGHLRCLSPRFAALAPFCCVSPRTSREHPT